eukprot:TRINITY_DN1922_c0_g1_i1.p1 TRINITY_DN1922_c0_g1~~TRINITY_DN1922_c0_g1_i1.p1  ORF type:complete len:402 (+),score=59.86 TRINITY_DN1922_c0_g1_i1:48-1253(+)
MILKEIFKKFNVFYKRNLFLNNFNNYCKISYSSSINSVPKLIDFNKVSSRIPFEIIEQSNIDKEKTHKNFSNTLTSSPKTIMNWVEDKPKTILLIKKPDSDLTKEYAEQTIDYICKHHKDSRILVEPSCSSEFSCKKYKNRNIYTFKEEEIGELGRVVDFIICLGGDGTLLYSSQIFTKKNIPVEHLKLGVPPILSFSLGTVSFLTSNSFNNFETVINKIFNNSFYITNRMRLHIRLRRVNGSVEDFDVINEAAFHRGLHGAPLKLNCYINDTLLTKTNGDGLIVATATGSTGYSLSCGGSMVHPSVNSILITPVCPMSLSFRPLVLPCDLTVKLVINSSIRCKPVLLLDGLETIQCEKNDTIEVRRSIYSIPTISKKDAVTDWVRDINENLRWNQDLKPK